MIIKQKIISIICISILFIALFFGFNISSASADVYMCNGYSIDSLYRFSRFNYYSFPADMSRIAYYYLDDCFTGTGLMGSVFKGRIGNSTLLNSHTLGGECSDGTCKYTQNPENFTSASQGDLYLVAVYDCPLSADCYEFQDWYTGAGITTPSDKHTEFYFWYGEGDYTIPTDALFGEDISIFEAEMRNKIPFVYYYDIRDMLSSKSDDFIYTSVSYLQLYSSEISDLKIGITSGAFAYGDHEKVEFQLFDADIIFDIISVDTFETIRDYIKIALWVIVAFLLIRQIKKILTE